jgi:hypothetical protein
MICMLHLEPEPANAQQIAKHTLQGAHVAVSPLCQVTQRTMKPAHQVQATVKLQRFESKERSQKEAWTCLHAFER